VNPEIDTILLSHTAEEFLPASQAKQDGNAAPLSLNSFRQEPEQLEILVDITNTVLSALTIDGLVEEVTQAMHRIFSVEFVGLNIFDIPADRVQSHGVYFPHGKQALRQMVEFSYEDMPLFGLPQGKKVFLANRQELRRLLAGYPLFVEMGTDHFQCVCIQPLISGNKMLGALLLADHLPQPVFSHNLALLQHIAARIALALNNALAYQEISYLKERLASENLLLNEKIRHYESFDEIIGQSKALALVLNQVDLVADSDCTALILGETGTGKELIARAIHQRSRRKKQRMVTMNCAAIPANLLESDLFGHEKGAFTGATARRMGRFEAADHGTLFLDEVGDIPLELQAKLLRVLQEREIERLGGHGVIAVDVRVIAATSCNLPQMIADKRYRSDLYYRLNVFPIVVPPLRERPEDIPLLAQFFTKKYAQRMNRTIESIPLETIDRLMQHPWPGNIRELQNVIERAVILTRGPVLHLPSSYLQYEPSPAASKAVAAPPAVPRPPLPDDITESEREQIIRLLKETNGIVAGPKGAAARLGLKRTTLLSRMQRLGISHKSIDDEAD